MIRLALPKGRNQQPVVEALRAAGLELAALERGERRLLLPCPEDGCELLLLKGWDVPRYVEYGVADLGVVGSDVLAEIDGDLLVPARFRAGRSRLSLIGPEGAMPKAGSQVRLATKYPGTARRLLHERSWGAEILELSGSIELAPILDLADVALDIVQTGRTLAENHLVELEQVAEVADCLVVNRASFQQHRESINGLVDRLEAAGVVA